MSNTPDKRSRRRSSRLLALLSPVILTAMLLGFCRPIGWTEAQRFQTVLNELKTGKCSGCLSIGGTQDWDSLLVQARGMPEIESVFIQGGSISIVGMQHLGSLPNLKWLAAYGEAPGFCDEGILELRNCSKLESLTLYGAPLTEEGIAKLKLYVPNVRVATTNDD